MRTFTFSDAKSHKFWNIDLSGNSFTVTYGKIGTAGQTQTKTFADATKAQAEHDKLIKEKTSKGYVETSSVAAKSPREILETAIRESPHDKAPYAAYADFLMEQGDPQGEFMQVQLALEDESLGKAERKKLQAKETELLNTYQRQWLGSMAPILLDLEGLDDYYRENKEYHPKFRFKRGLWTELEFRNLKVNAARALNSCPESRFLQTVLIGETSYEEEGEFEAGDDIEEGDEHPSASLLPKWKYWNGVRVFRLGEPMPELSTSDDYFSCHTSGEIAYHILKQAPNIEEAYILAHRVDANKVFALPMPNLRVLQLFHTHGYPLDKLAKNDSLTNLTTLLCHPHALEYDDEPYIRKEHIKAIARSAYLKKLRHLRLCASNAGDDGIRELLHGGFIKQLEIIDLSHGRISDEGAQLLAKSGLLTSNQQLYLFDNAMTQVGIDALQATGVQLHASGQNPRNLTSDEEEAEYLFQGDIE